MRHAEQKKNTKKSQLTKLWEQPNYEKECDFQSGINCI